MPFGRLQSEESENHLLEDDGYTKRSTMNSQDYLDRKPRLKKKYILTNKQNDGQRNSNYSSSSRYTSFLRGNSVSEPEIVLFKQSQSAYYNQLKQKYLERDAPPEKIREEMILTLERKVSELEALRIHRDELKFISNNNPYSNPIKIGFAVLKEKAKTEQKVRSAIQQLNKDIKEIDEEFNTMTEYFSFIKTSLEYTGDQNLIIDTQEQEKLMIENLQNETNHLFRELRESDKKNAKETKEIQVAIGNLRVAIKQKQDKIRDLKSKICTMYIKLHSRNSSSKEKNLSLSIRKFNSDQHNKIQEAFIGNRNFRNFSKEIIEKVSDEQELSKIIFYCQGPLNRKQIIAFRCIYKGFDGKIHKNMGEQNTISGKTTINQAEPSPRKGGQISQFQISTKYMLSMKFFFRSKIVGVECRVKTQKGNKTVSIGDCQPNIDHQLLTLVNKKVVTLGSFWHHKEMIGVGVWYSSRLNAATKRDTSSSASKRTLKKVKSDELLSRQNNYNDYYAN